VDSSLVAVLTGSGGAAAVLGALLICFMTGIIYPKSVVADKDDEIAALKQALATERTRGDAAVAAAQSSRDLVAAIQTGISIARQASDGGVHPGGPGT
jgi:hypothetical protein